MPRGNVFIDGLTKHDSCLHQIYTSHHDHKSAWKRSINASNSREKLFRLVNVCYKKTLCGHKNACTVTTLLESIELSESYLIYIPQLRKLVVCPQIRRRDPDRWRRDCFLYKCGWLLGIKKRSNSLIQMFQCTGVVWN